MAHSNYLKEQKQNIQSTPQELDAWEALRREPGLMGRLARRGKHMKPDFVGGRRSFYPNSGPAGMGDGSKLNAFGNSISAESQQDTRDSVTAASRGVGNNSNSNSSGPTKAQIAAQEAANKAKEDAKAAKAAEEKAEKEAKEKVITDRAAKRKGYVEGTENEDGTMNYDGSLEGVRQDYKSQRDKADYSGYRDGTGTGVDASGKKVGEAGYNSETEVKEGGLKQYQEQADKLSTEAGTKFGGYESQISKMPDRASEVAGYGADVNKVGKQAQTDLAGLNTGIGTNVTAGQSAAQTGQTAMANAAGEVGKAGTKFGDMAAQAQDTGGLMKDRGLFAGQMEAKRKAGQKGKIANLRRSMAAAGSSPEEIARAEAETSSAGGQEGREDALAASMASMQSGQSQLGQAAGMRGQQMNASGLQAQMAGQQAGLGLSGAQLGMSGLAQQGQNIQAGAGMRMQGTGQAAGMAGQAQQMGLNKVGAEANMYGQGLQAQTGLMNTGANLVNQQQSSQMNEINQQAALTGAMSNTTQAQLQDTVAMQNQAQQKDLAERGLLLQQQTNAANQPQAPSQQDQMLGLVKTGATVKIAFACIPDGTFIDMVGERQMPIDKIKVGDFVVGMDGQEDEVLQVHQYKEDPKPIRFVTITFDDGSKVDTCDNHRISGKRAEDYRLQDKIGSREVTNIKWYNGVNRSYDLLTATGGYRINGVPVNTMIIEMAEMITKSNNNIKLAA